MGLPKLREMERQLILARLDLLDGNKPATAKSLGISLKTLYNKLRKYQEGGWYGDHRAGVEED